MLVVASMDWWRFQPDSDIMALEQAESEKLLADWLVVTKNPELWLCQMAHRLKDMGTIAGGSDTS